MQRIATSEKATDLFGAGKHGFKDGNLGLGINPTQFEADYCNDLQEELMSIIEGAGVAPSTAVTTQIRQAIKRLCGGNLTTVNFAASPFALTADHAGLVLVDASGGNVVLNLPAANVVTAVPIEYAFVRVDASVNTATVDAAGADTIGGAPDFAVAGQYSNRSIRSNAVDAWLTLSASVVSSARQIQPILASVAASALTLTLSPTQLDFRAPALTSGTVNARTLAAAATLVVPSGATLGTVNAVASRLVLLALDNAGAIELAVVNLAGGNNLDETTLISTTAIDAASDSANVVYSNAARSNLPFRVVGFVESTQAAAGTWATAPSTIQGIGGQALAAMASLGYGQAPQNVTGSRAALTTYRNTTGKPIFLHIVNTMGSATYCILTITGPAGAVQIFSQTGSGGGFAHITAVVPPGFSYYFDSQGSGSLTQWTETR